MKKSLSDLIGIRILRLRFAARRMTAFRGLHCVSRRLAGRVQRACEGEPGRRSRQEAQLLEGRTARHGWRDWA